MRVNQEYEQEAEMLKPYIAKVMDYHNLTPVLLAGVRTVSQ